MAVAYVPLGVEDVWRAGDACTGWETRGALVVVASVLPEAVICAANSYLQSAFAGEVPPLRRLCFVATDALVLYDVPLDASLEDDGRAASVRALMVLAQLSRRAIAAAQAEFDGNDRSEAQRKNASSSHSSQSDPLPMLDGDAGEIGSRARYVLGAYCRAVAAAMALLCLIDSALSALPAWLRAIWRTLKAHSAIHANLQARWATVVHLAAGAPGGGSLLEHTCACLNANIMHELARQAGSSSQRPNNNAGNITAASDDANVAKMTETDACKLCTDRATVTCSATHRPGVICSNCKSQLSGEREHCTKVSRVAEAEKRTAHRRDARNALLQLANDAALGAVAGAALLRWAPAAARLAAQAILGGTVFAVEARIVWLMGWPAGMKLNANLDKFAGEMALWLLALWSVAIEPAVRQLAFGLRALGCVSLLTGASGAAAVAADCASLLTLHVPLFYALCARVLAAQMRVLASLCHLFRGRRWNALRGRLDSADYELDQLLLGTVLLALLVFLWPTVAVYYALFLAYRVSVSVLVLGVFSAVHGALVATPFYTLAARLSGRHLVASLRLGVAPSAPSSGLCFCDADSDASGESAAPGVAECRLPLIYTQPQSIAEVMAPLARSLAAAPAAILTVENARRAITGRPVSIVPGANLSIELALFEDDSTHIAAIRSQIAAVRQFALSINRNN